MTCSPLAEAKFQGVAQVKSDLLELSKKVKIRQLDIIGGEPLLHPDVTDFMRVVRAAFPKSIVSMTTNCLLIPKMSADFWSTCRKENIVLHLTVYPPFEKNADAALALARRHGICAFKIDNKPIWVLPVRSLKQSKNDSNAVFSHCRYVFCHKLWNSKLYLCPMCFFQHYNRYFNESHPTIKGYDIYKYSGKELVEFMKRPDPACRYCTWVMKKETTQWGYSKREKSEWCEDV